MWPLNDKAMTGKLLSLFVMAVEEAEVEEEEEVEEGEEILPPLSHNKQLKYQSQNIWSETSKHSMEIEANHSSLKSSSDSIE